MTGETKQAQWVDGRLPTPILARWQIRQKHDPACCPKKEKALFAGHDEGVTAWGHLRRRRFHFPSTKRRLLRLHSCDKFLF